MPFQKSIQNAGCVWLPRVVCCRSMSMTISTKLCVENDSDISDRLNYCLFLWYMPNLPTWLWAACCRHMLYNVCPSSLLPVATNITWKCQWVILKFRDIAHPTAWTVAVNILNEMLQTNRSGWAAMGFGMRDRKWGECMTSLLYPFTACMGPNFSEELYLKIPHTARHQIHGPQIFQQKISLFLHIH